MSFLINHEDGVYRFYFNGVNVEVTDAEAATTQVDDSHLIGGGTVVERARLIAQEKVKRAAAMDARWR